MQKQNKQVEKINTQPNQPSKFDQIQSQYRFIIRQVLYEKLYHESEQFNVYVNEVLEDRSDEVQVKAEYQEGQNTANLNSSSTLGQENGQNELMSVLSKKNMEQSDKNALKQKYKKKKIYQEKDFFVNQDKALNLAQKMMRMKQQRQKKHQIARQNIKIFLQKQKQQNQLKKLQALAMSPQNLNLFKRTSTQIKKGNNSQLGSYYDHRYKVQNQLAFSRTRHNQSMNSHQKNLRNYNIKKVPNMFSDLNALRSQYNSLTLTPRQLNNSMIQKRNMQREIQILKKSKKISLKYEVKKFLIQILVDLANKCVDLVEKKKQFYHYSPPLKIHQIIDKNNPAYKKYRKKLQKRKKKQARKLKQEQSKIKSAILESKEQENNNKRTKTSRISQAYSLNIKGKEQQEQQKSESIQNSQSSQNSDNSSQDLSQNQSNSEQSSNQSQNNEKQSESSSQSSLQFQGQNLKISKNQKNVAKNNFQTKLQDKNVSQSKKSNQKQEIKKVQSDSKAKNQQIVQTKAQIQLIDRSRSVKKTAKIASKAQRQDIQRRNIGTKQFKRTKISSFSANKTQNKGHANGKNVQKPIEHKIRINSEVRITQNAQIQQLQLENSQKISQNPQTIKSINQSLQLNKITQNSQLNVQQLKTQTQLQKNQPQTQKIQKESNRNQKNNDDIQKTLQIKNQVKIPDKINKKQKKQKVLKNQSKIKAKTTKKIN